MARVSGGGRSRKPKPLTVQNQNSKRFLRDKTATRLIGNKEQDHDTHIVFSRGKVGGVRRRLRALVCVLLKHVDLLELAA